jgi:hypothetical protein
VALSCDLIDLDRGPDDDLQLARRALQHARSDGESFDLAFDSVVEHFASRPAPTHSDRQRRTWLLASLSDLRDVWRRAYERRDEPRPSRPQQVRTVPLDVSALQRICWKPKRPKSEKACAVCGRSWLPSYGHELTCSRECRLQLRRRRETAEARRRRAQEPSLA